MHVELTAFTGSLNLQSPRYSFKRTKLPKILGTGVCVAVYIILKVYISKGGCALSIFLYLEHNKGYWNQMFVLSVPTTFK